MTDRVLEYVLSDAISMNCIRLNDLSDGETRAFVDLLGQLVKNELDIDAYIRKAVKHKTNEDLSTYSRVVLEKVHKKIYNKIRTMEDGLHKRAITKLLSMKLQEIKFKNTAFRLANESTVLREYMFFLGMISQQAIRIDINNSDIPAFTELFWLLPYVPVTIWPDKSPLIPPSPLSFIRHGDVHEFKGYVMELEDVSLYLLGEKVRGHCQQAKDYIHDGWYKKGIGEIEKALEEDPCQIVMNVASQCYISLARNHEEKNKYEEAITVYEKIIELNRDVNSKWVETSHHKIELCREQMDF